MARRIVHPFNASRRKFIKGMGATILAAPLSGLCTGCESTSGDTSYRTKLVLLGTTGGVSWWPNCGRASSSSAVVVEDTIYLVDIGQGSAARLAQAFNIESMINEDGTYRGTGSSTFMKNIRTLFFTHLHQDHTADYPSLLLIGPGTGLNATRPLKVIGPGNRGQIELNKCDFDENRIIYTDSADPDRITATPGTLQLTETVWQAFAQTINNMTLDAGYPDFRNCIEVKEITEIGTELPFRNSPTCPPTSPATIYEDELVRVTATLVDHHQVYPAFAFRFDTDDGSIVFSGDTGPETNGNLQLLAAGADVLIHEVIDRQWVDYRFGDPEEGTPEYALKMHMLEAHTAIDAVGPVAESCGVKTLILNHIVPGVTPLDRLQNAQNGFSGKLIIGQDLMEIGIG